MPQGTPLTWRNVDAPDFGTALQGMKQFSEMLGGAFDSAQGVVNKIDASRDAVVQKELASRLLKYRDPAAYEAALASGQIFEGLDPKRLSAENFTDAGQNVDRLLKTADLSSDFRDQENDRKIAGDRRAAGLEVNPIVQKASMIAATQGRPAALAYLQNPEVAPLLGKLEPDQYRALLDDQLKLGEDTLDYDGKAFNQTTSQLEYNETRQAAGESLSLLNESGAADPVEFIGWLNTSRADLIKRGYSPVVIDKIRNRVLEDKQWPLLRERLNEEFAAAPSGGNVNVGAVVGSPDAVSALQTGATQLGISPEDLATIISYETKGKFDPSIRGGKNNKHIGLIQFGEDEQRDFGAAQNQSFPQQMGSVVKYLKARGVRPGDDITTLYKIINGGSRDAAITASDGNGTIGGHVQNMLRDHRDSAARFLGGTRGAQVASRAGIAIGVASNPQVQLYRDFVPVLNDNTPSRALSVQATTKGGIFEGDSRSNIEDRITAVAQKYEISPAMALKVLERSTDGDRSRWNPKRILGGHKVAFDDDKIDHFGKLAQNREGIENAALALDGATQVVAGMDAANAQAAAATQRAKRGIRASELLYGRVNTPGNARNVGDVANAQQAQVDATNVATGSNQGFRPDQRQTRGPAKRAGQASEKTKPKPARIIAEAIKAPSKQDAILGFNRTMDVVRANLTRIDKARSPAGRMKPRADLNRAVSKAIDLAIATGVSKYQRKPDEPAGAFRERIRGMIVRK